jgi:hypothetical protein
MSGISVTQPYQIFTDRQGVPLEAGYIYVGTANLDPIANPINIYWDAALTIAATQPVRTVGGYPMRSGSPARIFAESDYSIAIYDRNNQFIISAPNSESFTPSADSVTTDMIQDGAIDTDKLADDAVTTDQILNESVTYAKLQDVSATARVLGRKTAGAGVVEEITLTELLDFIGSAAWGDILFRGENGWARLAAGDLGKILTTNGVGANPTWESNPVGLDVVAGDLEIGSTSGSATHDTIPGSVTCTFNSVFNGTFRINIEVTNASARLYRNSVELSGPYVVDTEVDSAGWSIGDEIKVIGLTTAGPSGGVTVTLSVAFAACGIVGTTVSVNGTTP